MARRPTRYEQKILSLAAIPVHLDHAVNKIKLQLPVLLITQNESAQEQLLFQAMRDMALYGATEMRAECKRQGAWFHFDPPKEPLELESAVTSALADLRAEAGVTGTLVASRLHRRRLPEPKRLNAIGEHLDDRFVALAAKYARRVVNEAFSLGRAQEMRALAALPGDRVVSLAKRGGRKRVPKKNLIEDVIQSAVLDKNTCQPCKKVDGEVTQFGSDRQKELMPPYYLCKGGDNCRCVQIAVVGDGTVIEIVDNQVVDQEDPN